MQALSTALQRMAKLIQLAAMFIWPLGTLLMWEWYFGWLDQYFFPWKEAALLCLITVPLVPVAVVIEILWHGWSGELWMGLVSLLGFILLLWTGWLLEQAESSQLSYHPPAHRL